MCVYMFVCVYGWGVEGEGEEGEGREGERVGERKIEIEIYIKDWLHDCGSSLSQNP